MKRPTALLIPSPWSGDESQPIPRTYSAWFWLYRTTRQLRHAVELHDWADVPGFYADKPGRYRQHCHWCGASR